MNSTTQQSIRVGIFFIIGVLLVWATFETLDSGTFTFGKPKGDLITAQFPDLKELKKGSDVRMNGVKIGAIEGDPSIQPGNQARIMLRIDEKYRNVIPVDSVGTIGGAGLIPSNFVDIAQGKSGLKLADGGELKTAVTPDLTSVMRDLGNLGSKLDSALGSLGDAFKGKEGQPGLFEKIDKLVTDNNAKIGETMTNLQEVTAKINKGEGTLGKLINDPALHDELLAALKEIKGGVDEAKGFMAKAQEIVDQVKSGKGTLGALLYDDTAANNIKVVTQNFRDVSDKIARGEGTLGMLLNDDKMAKDLQGTIKKAERALDGLEDAGPINAVGVVAKSLF